MTIAASPGRRLESIDCIRGAIGLLIVAGHNAVGPMIVKAVTAAPDSVATLIGKLLYVGPAAGPIALGEVSWWLFANHPMGAPDVPDGYTWSLGLLYQSHEFE